MPEINVYNGLLGLDRLPRWSKTVIWLFGFILAITMTVSITFNPFSPNPEKLPKMLALYCLLSACLRLLGIPWRNVLAFWFATLLFHVLLFFWVILVAARQMA